MKTKFMVTIDSTKASEIEALYHIANKLPRDTYIGSLLTDDFLVWAEGRIKSDFTIDLFEMTESLERKLRTENTRVEKLEGEVRVYAESHGRLNDRIMAAEKEFAGAAQEHEEAYLTLNLDTSKQIALLQAELRDQRTKTDSLLGKVIDHEKAIELRNTRINDLKAKLYDRAELRKEEGGG